jgi:FlgD Ig-like domain
MLPWGENLRYVEDVVGDFGVPPRFAQVFLTCSGSTKRKMSCNNRSIFKERGKKMKRFTVIFSMVLIFGLIGTSNAALQVIGTAEYLHGTGYPIETCNVIYDSDSGDSGLVWLDYPTYGDYPSRVNWLTHLGDGIVGNYVLTVTLDPAFTTDIDFGSGWRLPVAGDSPQAGNVNVGELGHLYYNLLGKPEENGTFLPDSSPFATLAAGIAVYPMASFFFWTGTLDSANPSNAWRFDMNWGVSGTSTAGDHGTGYALVVHDGTVSAASAVSNLDVPRPGSITSIAPNPFNPQTTIAFDLPGQAAVRLGVFDVAGHLVKELISGDVFEQGRHEAVWNGRDATGCYVASGTYFCRIEAGNYVETKRMALLK